MNINFIHNSHEHDPADKSKIDLLEETTLLTL